MERLTRLLKATTGKVVYGGSFNTPEKFITPTIITKIDKHDVCMEEEIFGPILPVMNVDSSEEAITYVNTRERPLVIYVYSTDTAVKHDWMQHSISGSLTFNECFLQMSIPSLPFGGVGNSGMGRYFGKASIKLFSNPRSICDKSTSEHLNNAVRYPPYDDPKKEKIARWYFSSPADATAHLCTIS